MLTSTSNLPFSYWLSHCMVACCKSGMRRTTSLSVRDLRLDVGLDLLDGELLNQETLDEAEGLARDVQPVVQRVDDGLCLDKVS